MEQESHLLTFAEERHVLFSSYQTSQTHQHLSRPAWASGFLCNLCIVQLLHRRFYPSAPEQN
jgi:hypothetical protein